MTRKPHFIYQQHFESPFEDTLPAPTLVLDYTDDPNNRMLPVPVPVYPPADDMNAGMMLVAITDAPDTSYYVDNVEYIPLVPKLPGIHLYERYSDWIFLDGTSLDADYFIEASDQIDQPTYAPTFMDALQVPADALDISYMIPAEASISDTRWENILPDIAVMSKAYKRFFERDYLNVSGEDGGALIQAAVDEERTLFTDATPGTPGTTLLSDATPGTPSVQLLDDATPGDPSTQLFEDGTPQ